MKSEQLLDAMSGIDDKYLEESEKTVSNILRFSKWKTFAVCACLVLVLFGSMPVLVSHIGLGGSSSSSEDRQMEIQDTTENGAAKESSEDSSVRDVGFEFNGSVYVPADEVVFEAYELADKDISEQDRGTLMGTIEDAKDEELNGCKVYHVKGYEDSDEICLVEKEGRYRLYCVA